MTIYNTTGSKTEHGGKTIILGYGLEQTPAQTEQGNKQFTAAMAQAFPSDLDFNHLLRKCVAQMFNREITKNPFARGNLNTKLEYHDEIDKVIESLAPVAATEMVARYIAECCVRTAIKMRPSPDAKTVLDEYMALVTSRIMKGQGLAQFQSMEITKIIVKQLRAVIEQKMPLEYNKCQILLNKLRTEIRQNPGK